MGDHVLDRSTSVSVKGEFVFLFWPFFGLVSVELLFEAVLGDVLRPRFPSNLAETDKRSYSTRPKKSPIVQFDATRNQSHAKLQVSKTI